MPRQPIPAPLVEQGHDLPFQQLVDGVGLDPILVVELLLVILLAMTDGPACLGRIALVPPAIQNAQVQSSVCRGLHAAGAAGLVRPARRVEPDIDPLDQVTRDAHVIVLDEHDSIPEFRPACIVDDLADQLLSGIVPGMGLAGKDHLHRPFPIPNDPGQPVHITEQERGPLVGSKPPCKADGQRFRVEHLIRQADLRRAGSSHRQLAAQPAPGIGHETLPAPLVRAP